MTSTKKQLIEIIAPFPSSPPLLPAGANISTNNYIKNNRTNGRVDERDGSRAQRVRSGEPGDVKSRRSATMGRRRSIVILDFRGLRDPARGLAGRTVAKNRSPRAARTRGEWTRPYECGF